MRSRDMFIPQMPSEEMALPGRTTEMKITDSHYIQGLRKLRRRETIWCMPCLGWVAFGVQRESSGI